MGPMEWMPGSEAGHDDVYKGEHQSCRPDVANRNAANAGWSRIPLTLRSGDGCRAQAGLASSLACIEGRCAKAS